MMNLPKMNFFFSKRSAAYSWRSCVIIFESSGRLVFIACRNSISRLVNVDDADWLRISHSFWFNYKSMSVQFPLQIKSHQLNMRQAFFKVEGMCCSKSPVHECLGTCCNLTWCWPWTQLIKKAINEIQFNWCRPTRQNILTKDLFLRATLPQYFINSSRCPLDLNNGL